MSLSRSLAQGRDHDRRVYGHTTRAIRYEDDAHCAGGTGMLHDIHAARLEWAMAVCALLAWVRYGEGER